MKATIGHIFPFPCLVLPSLPTWGTGTAGGGFTHRLLVSPEHLQTLGTSTGLGPVVKPYCSLWECLTTPLQQQCQRYTHITLAEPNRIRPLVKHVQMYPSKFHSIQWPPQKKRALDCTLCPVSACHNSSTILTCPLYCDLRSLSPNACRLDIYNLPYAGIFICSNQNHLDSLETKTPSNSSLLGQQ